MNPFTHPTRFLRSRVKSKSDLFFAQLWVLVAAWCTLSGWVLSLAGFLNIQGYCSSFVIGAVGLYFCAYARGGSPVISFGWRNGTLTRWRNRFRRPLPFIFISCTVLTFVGAALYRPTNYDALVYRFPRILNWLETGRWHWIETFNSRINYSGTGFEWLMTPLFVFSHTDRFLFLINFLPFLLLPSVTFCFLREMGVKPRVAWYWMWLLPLAHGFILQAGGIGNDAYAALFLLVSLIFALRANQSNRIDDLGIAAIAAALVTGSKVANVPLLLPFLIAACPARRLLIKHKIASVAISTACVLVSFVPTAVLNQVHTGGWTGDPLNKGRMTLHNPIAGFVGNSLQLIIHNFAPPVFPFQAAAQAVAARIQGDPWFRAVNNSYPRLGLVPMELAVEEQAGLGMGLSLLFLISLMLFVRRPKHLPLLFSASNHGWWIAISGWFGLSVFMMKVGSEAAPRLVAAYYPLCLSLALLHPGNGWLVRRRWWRVAAGLASLSILPAILLSPARPLWPARSVLAHLVAVYPENRMIERMNTVYSVYAQRADVLAPLKRYIPEGQRVIGFAGNADDPATSLWRPFGQRRVIEIVASNQDEWPLENSKPIYAVVSRDGISSRFGKSVEDWMGERHLTVVAKEKITVKIQRGDPDEWFVIVPESSEKSQH